MHARSASGSRGRAPSWLGRAPSRVAVLSNAPQALCLFLSPSLSCWVILFYFTILLFHVKPLFKKFRFFSATADIQHHTSFGCAASRFEGLQESPRHGETGLQ